MTVSSTPSETGTIRPSSQPKTRTPLVRTNTTPKAPLSREITNTTMTNTTPMPNPTLTPVVNTSQQGAERKSKSNRPRLAPLILPKKKPPVFPDPLPANAVILHHRGKAFLHIRPPTPIPLRPSTPIGLRGHSKLPSTTVAGLLDASPLDLTHSKESSGDTKPLSISNKSGAKSHTRSRSEENFVMIKARPPPKGPLPPIPSSPSLSSTLSRKALSNHNGTPSKSTLSKSKRPPPIDITNFLDLGEDKENLTIPTIPDGSDVPITPVSAAFPSSKATSDAESDKAAKLTKPIDEVVHSCSNSAKSVRWAEMALFPEQQSLVNIHGLLRTLVEDSKDEEIVKACEIMKRFLPQAGVLAERKYTLRSTQEEELEHSLRILDGSLFRQLDKESVEKARKCLLKLVPAIQQRFATLPYHREVQRLKSERSQLKEDRALVLVQLAIQETEIKTAQARREAERNREIEEAALRRLKRREEKLRERKTYDKLRTTLENRSKELKVIGEELEKEMKKLITAREERDRRNLEKAEKGIARIKMSSIRVKERLNWF